MAYVQLLDWVGSDHRPLLIHTGDKKWKGDQFHEALKRCRSCLSRWKTKNNNNSAKKIQDLKSKLQKEYNSSPLDLNQINLLKSALTHEYRMEEEYWKTKSRIQWLQAGDRNTNFFHTKTKQRRNHNRITALADAHGKIWTTEEEKELYQAVHTMAREKAPGPDGFNPGFYQDHWATIRTVMKQMGFSEVWCNWIMKCITTVSYSVLLNGKPTGLIYPSRGIRQGDPILPYIYLLCTEALSAMIQESIRLKSLHGFKASRNGPAISHLLFTDDSLLFCKATDQECTIVLNILQQHEKASEGRTENGQLVHQASLPCRQRVLVVSHKG
ncbi:PREDICTED: uncharacterized protein LOC104757764 isoform X2 [Camelina sativa]|uniref:Uncharacterized protein LOC104757764 isoform X2 n=1 Tax=Camelina sativa TaxID=90675 RepID=A0ABM1R733_CAMSA|nr:PREDICTED: uncharacterized protein LOC104757764 isoform X2 [Camelina sativa]